MRFVTMAEGNGACAMDESTPPRHSRQVPSDDRRVLLRGGRSWVQPSGQQMPSIAFNDANKISIATARSLRTSSLSSASGGTGVWGSTIHPSGPRYHPTLGAVAQALRAEPDAGAECFQIDGPGP